MATLDDILTTQKNGVVAINNLNQTLLSFYKEYLYVAGTTTSPGYNASTLITPSAGRLVAINVIANGSAASIFYNYETAPTTATAGNGATATITYSGTYSFIAGDTVVVSGVIPSGYNGTYTVTASTSNTVSFASATTGAQTSPGTVFNPNVTRSIAAAPFSAVGVYPVGAFFPSGLYMIRGAGQTISVTYSLD
jgi:hypothetical protein